MSKNLIFATLGDPAGLGPELFARLLTEQRFDYPLVLFGLERSLVFHCQQLGLDFFWQSITNLSQVRENKVYLLEPPGLENVQVTFGQPSVQGGLVAGRSLELACQYLQQGWSRVLITGPLDKFSLQEAGFNFAGHTEFLASSFGLSPDQVCMYFAGPDFDVSLITTHPPLKDVPQLITPQKLELCVNLSYNFAQKIHPELKIGVCGLNPHAGEQGKIGREELEIIQPVLAKLKAKGMHLAGPLPADTLFYQAKEGKYNLVIAMYHDQGLAPLKMLYFGQCVNITLGLPIWRFSVDHGTGYDLVGKNKAKLDSLRRCFELAKNGANF